MIAYLTVCLFLSIALYSLVTVGFLCIFTVLFTECNLNLQPTYPKTRHFQRANVKKNYGKGPPDLSPCGEGDTPCPLPTLHPTPTPHTTNNRLAGCFKLIR